MDSVAKKRRKPPRRNLSKTRLRMFRRTLDHWIGELNEWRWPLDHPRDRDGDGRDDIRGAYFALVELKAKLGVSR